MSRHALPWPLTVAVVEKQNPECSLAGLLSFDKAENQMPKPGPGFLFPPFSCPFILYLVACIDQVATLAPLINKLSFYLLKESYSNY